MDTSIPPLLKWGFEQGALVVLLLVISYFYRKDFQNNEQQQEQTIKMLTELVKQQQEFSSTILQKQAALTEQSIVVHSQVSAVLAEQSAAFKLILHDIIEQGTFSKGPRKNSGDT